MDGAAITGTESGERGGNIPVRLCFSYLCCILKCALRALEGPKCQSCYQYFFFLTEEASFSSEKINEPVQI